MVGGDDAAALDAWPRPNGGGVGRPDTGHGDVLTTLRRAAGTGPRPGHDLDQIVVEGVDDHRAARRVSRFELSMVASRLPPIELSAT